MSRPIPPSYKTKNWSAYNEALKQRGSLTIWFDPDMVWVPPATGKRGRQPQHSGEEGQETVRYEMRPKKHCFFSIEHAQHRFPDERDPDLPDDEGRRVSRN